MANNPESSPAPSPDNKDGQKIIEVGVDGMPIKRAPDSKRKFVVQDGLTPYIRKPQEMVKEEKSAADKAKMELEKLRSIINPQISLDQISRLINPGVSANNVIAGVPDMSGLNNHLGPVAPTYTDSYGNTVKIEVPKGRLDEGKMRADYIKWLQSDEFKVWAKTPDGIELLPQLPTVSPEGKLIYPAAGNNVPPRGVKTPEGLPGF